jgi:two-component system phosphate regulon sensor histidine kinase PhoR
LSRAPAARPPRAGNGPLLRRAVRGALCAALPGLVALAVLVLSGRLAPVPAVILAGAILVPGGVVLARLFGALKTLAEAGRTLAGTPAGERPARRGAGLGEAAREILRLAQVQQAQLSGARARLAAAEAIFAAIPDPLLVLDERRRIVRANQAAQALVGRLAGPRDLATALRDPAILAAAEAVLGGAQSRVVDVALTVPLARQLRAYVSRIEPAAPGGAAAALVLHDITGARRVEQLRTDFVANASHELRTPLATLAGFIETLRGPAREDAEARERFLAIMQQQAARMTRLVDDLLSLSRVELNEHVPPHGRVALAPLLREIADSLELRAGERDMKIELRLPPDLPEVIGERDELAQLFQNLLDNAIKYGRAGSTVALAAEPVLRPMPEGRVPFVAIAVRDEGEGIAREHLPRLTERFYRVDTARSRAMGGTGLGLAIVKHILNRHRGFLEIDSTPGVGSVFTAFLRPHAAR